MPTPLCRRSSAFTFPSRKANVCWNSCTEAFARDLAIYLFDPTRLGLSLANTTPEFNTEAQVIRAPSSPMTRESIHHLVTYWNTSLLTEDHQPPTTWHKALLHQLRSRRRLPRQWQLQLLRRRRRRPPSPRRPLQSLDSDCTLHHFPKCH